MFGKLATALAAIRVLFGFHYLRAPEEAAGGWIGRPARLEQSKLLARGFGVRDLVLGAGALYASTGRADPRPWYLAQAIAEGSDCVATLTSPARLPKSGYLVGAGLTAVSAVIFTAAAVER